MNENAASRASAMRCPGGRTAMGAGDGEAQSRTPANARTRSQSTCASMKSAITSSRASSRGRGQKWGRNRPGIEIDAFPPRRCGMKGWVDIVGAGFEADHVDAPALERAQETERRRRLAAGGARSGDHKPPGHRPTLGK